MTPNLRYDKKLTKKLVAAIPHKEDKIPLTSVTWHLDNDTDRLFGLCYEGLFKTVTFFLQKTEKDAYRLVVCNDQPLCGFFLIDDIERFMEVIGVEILEMVDPETLIECLRETKVCPNTGIVTVDDDGKVFIYEHCNY